MPQLDAKQIKIIRISTVPHSLHLLLRGQMKFMKSKGMSVTMMCSHGSEIPELIENEECLWIDVPLSREFNVWKDIKALFVLIKIFKKLNPDIVHSHSPKAGTVGMLAAKICNVPLRIHTVAGLPLMEFEGKKRLLLDLVEKVTYQCAQWILPNSKAQAAFIVDKGYVKAEKIKIIGEGSSNGINSEYYKKTPEVLAESKRFKEKHKIQDTDFVISFIGRLASYKGVNELVKAFVVLSKSMSNLKLILIGPFEELNPLESEVLSVLESDSNIITTGHVNDVRPYLASSNLFIFPSYREGFPQSLMQASAMGIPCVATDINGCNEIIEHEVNGILIKPKSVEDIIRAITLLAKDTNKLKLMAQMASEKISTGLDQKFIWNELYKFYVKHLNE